MNASAIQDYINKIQDGDRNFIRDAWDRLKAIPAGNLVFSRLVGTAAPYTGTIAPRVLELRYGHAEACIDDRRLVRNHLRSIHAVALTNLAEMTASLVMAYSMADDARFIITGLDIEFQAKARGTIRAVAQTVVPETASGNAGVNVDVWLYDDKQVEVSRAVVRALVGPKKR